MPGLVFNGLVSLSVGWGQAGTSTDWDVQIEIENGTLTEVEPRLRGVDIVDPLSPPPSSYAFSAWERTGTNTVRLRTRTVANPTVMTDATQQLVLRVSGTDRTVVRAVVNGVRVQYTVGELRSGPRSGYTAGFVSPAFQFHRAVADEERELEWMWRTCAKPRRGTGITCGCGRPTTSGRSGLRRG